MTKVDNKAGFDYPRRRRTRMRTQILFGLAMCVLWSNVAAASSDAIETYGDRPVLKQGPNFFQISIGNDQVVYVALELKEKWGRILLGLADEENKLRWFVRSAYSLAHQYPDYFFENPDRLFFSVSHLATKDHESKARITIEYARNAELSDAPLTPVGASIWMPNRDGSLREIKVDKTQRFSPLFLSTPEHVRAKLRTLDCQDFFSRPSIEAPYREVGWT